MPASNSFRLQISETWREAHEPVAALRSNHHNVFTR